MAVQDKGIVIGRTAYGESAFIVNIFTKSIGLAGFYVPGIRSGKSKAKAVLFAPLSSIGFTTDYRNSHKLLRLKQPESLYKTHNIMLDPVKQTVVMFMAELLSKCISPGHPDATLFAFLEETLIHLEEATDTRLFPVAFLAGLSDALGFYPDDSPNTYFDMSSGCFVAGPDIGSQTLNEVESVLFLRYLNDRNAVFSGQERAGLLKLWLDYLNVHHPGAGNLKSLEIIKSILRG